MIYVLNISGGKDSAALWAWAKRTGLGPRIQLSQNTGWEADFPGHRWIEHIRALEAHFGEPTRIVEGDRLFAQRVLESGTFPGRVNRRWCTEELKLWPAEEAVSDIRRETGDDVTILLGIRADESKKRETMPEREWSPLYKAEVWRPLINWTLEDVFAELHRTGVPINPLYKLGANRVGCWPCIKAGKTEIRLVADNDPGRIQTIRELETKTGTTMFCLEEPMVKGKRGKLHPTPIDEMVVWSKTARGGKQLQVIHEPSGCSRWALCERPQDEPASPPTGRPR